jgi:hypothetical protein
VAVLRNCSRKKADSFRVFETEALNRRRGNVRGPPGGLTTPGRGQEGGCAPSW